MSIAWGESRHSPSALWAITVLLLLTVLARGCAESAHAAPDVKFIQPRSTIVLAGPAGVSQIPLQARIEPHAANRWVQFEVWTGDLVVESQAWSLDGENAAALQPTYRPLHLGRLGHGQHTFRVLVCTTVTDESKCGRVRAMASMIFRVCGGEDEC